MTTDENSQSKPILANEDIIAVLEGLLLDIDGLLQEGFDTNIKAKHLPHQMEKGYIPVAVGYLA
jgi:hypothetical protein